jgi:cytochrome c-type biogenesis protein CcmF
LIWEDVLIYLVLTLYASGFATLALGRTKLGRALFIPASILGIIAFVSFVYLFLSNDFGTRAVFQSSSVFLPIPFKVVAALEGAGGSLLLWLAMMSAALFVYELRRQTPSRVTGLVVSLFTVYVSIALVFVNPFAQLGGSFTNGLGLTPSLQSYWALIHPPTVFSAYTAMVFLFAGLVSQRWRAQGDEARAPIDGRLFSATWTLLGLGLLFGGIWAYQTEGWGGYWAWDPIETSALVPWLILTAVMISSRMGTRLRSDYVFFGVTFSASTLLFTSYVARGSAAQSVHSYGNLASGASFILLSLFPALISVVVVVRRGTSATAESSFWDFESKRALEFWCLTLLASVNFVLLLLETIAPDFGLMFAPSSLAHNLASFPFVIGLLVLLSVECVSESSRREKIVVPIAAALSWAAALLYAITRSNNLIFDSVFPFAAALLASALLALAMKAAVNQKRLASSAISRYVTFVGLSLLVIGVLFSSGMRTSTEASIGIGQTVSVGGVNLTVLNVTTAPVNRTVYLPGHGSVSESIDTSVSYSLSGQAAGNDVAVLRYFPVIDEFVPVPTIKSSAGGDLYVTVAQTFSVIQATSAAFENRTVGEPAQVAISIQTIPDVSLVWLGAAVVFLANLGFVFMKPSDAASQAG